MYHGEAVTLCAGGGEQECLDGYKGVSLLGREVLVEMAWGKKIRSMEHRGGWRPDSGVLQGPKRLWVGGG